VKHSNVNNTITSAPQSSIAPASLMGRVMMYPTSSISSHVLYYNSAYVNCNSHLTSHNARIRSLYGNPMGCIPPLPPPPPIPPHLQLSIPQPYDPPPQQHPVPIPPPTLILPPPPQLPPPPCQGDAEMKPQD
jgi:hypothetical protein